MMYGNSRMNADVRRIGIDNSSRHRVTFAVDDVIPASEPLPEVPYKDALLNLLQDKARPLESWSQSAQPLLNIAPEDVDGHIFLLAVHRAFAEHRPLVLSSDMIWLLIMQGVAHHVTMNAEKLRRHFVQHDGKLVIEVRRDEFVKGFAGNDWEGVFAEFSGALETHIGAETHRLLVPAFSTTGIVERAAMEVTLMDTLYSYFLYLMTTACGIPSITLEGTPEDWERVRSGAGRLQEFDLDWWIPHLLPVLDQFVRASQGIVDRNFWRSFYKYEGFSGGPDIRGHVINFFPYLGRRRTSDEEMLTGLEAYLRGSETYLTDDQKTRYLAEVKDILDTDGFPQDTLHRNPYLGRTDLTMGEGLYHADVAGTLNSVPFIWQHLEAIYPMEFLAGFVGISQDPTTLALRPELGWAVRGGVA